MKKNRYLKLGQISKFFKQLIEKKNEQVKFLQKEIQFIQRKNDEDLKKYNLLKTEEFIIEVELTPAPKDPLRELRLALAELRVPLPVRTLLPRPLHRAGRVLFLCEADQIIEINDAQERRNKFETEAIDTRDINFGTFEQIIEFIGKVKID